MRAYAIDSLVDSQHGTERWRLWLVLGLIAGITGLHYATGQQFHWAHDIYRRLYYLPIVLGAFWYGPRWGLVLSLLVSAVYFPHLFTHWGGDPLGANLNRTLEIVLYNVIALVTGFLAEGQRNTSRALDRSYRLLKEQTRQLMEAERRLHVTERLSALGQLTAGLAHEIRTPLQTIQQSAEILSDSFGPGDAEHEFTELLRSEVERLEDIVRRFLNFARPEGGESRLSSVCRIFREVLERMSRRLEKSGIVVESDGLSADHDEVLADPGQLQHVFLNLVLNAIEAMPGGGRLTLGCEQDGDEVVVSIADEGEGISEEALPRLFDPFFTTKPQGTGLGMAIAHRIVSAHGGRLEARNRSEGAVFEVRLPVAKREGDDR